MCCLDVADIIKKKLIPHVYFYVVYAEVADIIKKKKKSHVYFCTSYADATDVIKKKKKSHVYFCTFHVETTDIIVKWQESHAYCDFDPLQTSTFPSKETNLLSSYTSPTLNLSVRVDEKIRWLLDNDKTTLLDLFST